MGRSPACQLEVRMTRLIAAGDAVTVFGEDLAISVDEDRTKWLITCIQRLSGELDAAAKIFVLARSLVSWLPLIMVRLGTSPRSTRLAGASHSQKPVN
jgi:hypothetical protein